MPRPARVSGAAESARDTVRAAQCRHEFHHRRLVGKVAELFDVNARVVVALIILGVRVALEIFKAQARALR
jgi:hypothetical protein